MALEVREKGVRRGRAEDNYAEATATLEPGSSANDMNIASDTVAVQARLTQRLMDKRVHVSLDEPYLGDPHKTVILVWGREEATPVGADRYNDDGYGSAPVPVSERLFTQGQEFAAPRWEPGKWIHFHLRFEEGPLGACTCGTDPDTIVGREAIVPGPVARHWFGDWDVVEYELRTRQGQIVEDWLKRTWHRDRVATENWGGYEMDFPPGVPVFDAKGAVNYRALRRFGPPAVPHVTITRLDTMMRRLPNTAAKPWDIFRWQDAVEKGPRMHFFENKHEGGIVSVTPDELQKLIAQGVAAFMAASDVQKKGPKSA
jgi:hypothetical protein